MTPEQDGAAETETGLAPCIYLALASLSEADWAAAFESGPDAVVIDASDLATDGSALPAILAGPKPIRIFVAVAGLSSRRIEADLDAAMSRGATGIILRGCVGLGDIDHLSAKLSVREAELDRPDGATRILAMADTAASVLALPSFAGARSRRLAGLGCDFDRLRAELRCRENAPALRVAAGNAVTAAAAARVPAIAVLGRGDGAADPWLRFDQLRGQGFRAILVRTAAEVEAAREVFGDP